MIGRRIGLALACLAALSVAACGTLGQTIMGGPVVVANQTKLDEQVGLSLTLAYTAAARAAALAIETGVVKDKATIAYIGQLDQRAYGAVKAVRAAYLAGNSASYLAAISAARAAVTDLLNAIHGPVAHMDRTPGDTKRLVQLISELTDGYVALRTADYQLARDIGGANA